MSSKAGATAPSSERNAKMRSHHSSTMFDNWYAFEGVAAHTFPSISIPLFRSDVRALIAHYQSHVNYKKDALTPHYLTTLVSLRKRVNDAMHSVPWGRSSHGVFVRMSSRSPKDAAFEKPLSHRTTERMAELLYDMQQDLIHQPPPEPLLSTTSESTSTSTSANTSAPPSSSSLSSSSSSKRVSIINDDNAVATCFFQASVDVLAVHNGDDAIALLTNSERVFLDNQLVADEWNTPATPDPFSSKESKGKKAPSSSSSTKSIDVSSEDKTPSGVSIIIREWQSMKLGCEWRGFVGANNKLNALSQYYNMLYFPSLNHHDTNASTDGQMMSAAVRSFYDRVLAKCAPATNIAPYVVDFIVLPRQSYIAANVKNDTTELPPAEQRWRVLIGEMNPWNDYTNVAAGSGSEMFDWTADRKILEQGPFTVRYHHNVPSGDLLQRFLSPDWQRIMTDAKLLYDNQQRRSKAASLLLRVVTPLALLIPLGLPASWAVALVLCVGAWCALLVHGTHIVPVLTQGARGHAATKALRKAAALVVDRDHPSLNPEYGYGGDDDDSIFVEKPTAAELTHECELCHEKFASHTYIVLHFLKAHPDKTPPLPPQLAAEQKQVHDQQVTQASKEAAAAAAAVAALQPNKDEKKRRGGAVTTGATKLAADDDGDSSGDEEDRQRARAPTTIAATVAAAAAAAAATANSTAALTKQTTSSSSSSSSSTASASTPVAVTFHNPSSGSLRRQPSSQATPPPLPSTKPAANASGAIAFGPHSVTTPTSVAAAAAAPKKPPPPPGGAAAVAAAREAKQAAIAAAAAVPLTDKEQQKLEKDREARRRVRLEITTSEESYVNSLGLFIAQFVQPLKADPNGYDLTLADVQSMFSNVEMLYHFHVNFLAELRIKEDVASLILKYADFLKMYTQYLHGYTSALDTFNRNVKNKKLQTLLSERRANCPLDFMSYLIMPVQRIPRYELLLRELIRYTPETHAESERLAVAFAKVQAIGAHVNEQQRHVENMSKLLGIGLRIKGDFSNLMQPHRHIIREGQVQRLEAATFGSNIKLRNVLLFNDLLLCTSDSQHYRGSIDLASAIVAEVAPDKKKPFAFELRPPPGGKAMVFVFANAKDRDSWQTDITSAIDSLAEHLRQVNARRQHHTKSLSDVPAAVISVAASGGLISPSNTSSSSTSSGSSTMSSPPSLKDGHRRSFTSLQ